MSDDMHLIDQWEALSEKSQTDFANKCMKDDALIYATFQTEQGQKLLERWKEILMYQPTIYPGKEDLISIGMAEGQKNLIRSLFIPISLDISLASCNIGSSL